MHFFDRVIIGEGVKISRTIVCEDVVIPPHLRVGFSKEEDRKLGIVIDHDSGIRVIPRI